MVGVAVGLDGGGRIPFVSAESCFWPDARRIGF
jgi:transketolase C-terminal domain/subunit